MGWRTTYRPVCTDLALDALQMAEWRRKRVGADLTGLVRHLRPWGAVPAPSAIDRLYQTARRSPRCGRRRTPMTMPWLRRSSSLCKAELILWSGTLGGHRRRLWSPPPSGSTGAGTTRPHSAIGMRTPAEHEAAWAPATHRQEQPQPTRSCCESTARHPRSRRVGRAFVPLTPRTPDLPYYRDGSRGSLRL